MINWFYLTQSKLTTLNVFLWQEKCMIILILQCCRRNTETQNILAGGGREKTTVLKPLQNRHSMEEFRSFHEVLEAKTRTKPFEMTEIPVRF